MSIGDKSIGINEPPRAKSQATPAELPKEAKVNPLKAMSPNCTVKASDDSASFAKFRLKFSKEEIDAINNGGVEVGDWRKIKMWEKKDRWRRVPIYFILLMVLFMQEINIKTAKSNSPPEKQYTFFCDC